MLPLDGIYGGFMERETESAQDYYILFGDTCDPAPIDYEKRCRQDDLLIADKWSYVWGYVGKIKREQEDAVCTRLDLEFLGRFFDASNISDANSLTIHGTYGHKIFVREPKALGFFAQVSPNLAFLPSMYPLRYFWFYPEADDEKRLLDFLADFCHAEEKKPTFSWFTHKKLLTGKCRSLVYLFSSEALMDIWQRAGYRPHMDLLRRTAVIWHIDSISGKIDMSQIIRKPVDAELIETSFKSIVLDDKRYIPTLTLRQLEILEECVDIVNSIRTLKGGGDQNIENIYEAIAVEKRKAMRSTDDHSSHPPLLQTTDQPAPSGTINATPTVPTVEPPQQPIVQEAVAEQEDIADIVARLEAQSEGRWVSQDEFSDLDINVKYKTTKTLQRYREKDNVKWSENNPALGMDKAGNFLERSGKDRYNYEYRYFLLRKFDKQPPPPVPHDPSHVPNGN